MTKPSISDIEILIYLKKRQSQTVFLVLMEISRKICNEFIYRDSYKKNIDNNNILCYK